MDAVKETLAPDCKMQAGRDDKIMLITQLGCQAGELGFHIS